MTYQDSKAAVKELVDEIATRWPREKSEIKACFGSYVRNLCGEREHLPPLLNAEQVRSVGREVLDGWTKRSFPMPGDFVTPRDSRTAIGKRKVDDDLAGRISDARNAGIKAYDWDGTPHLGEFWATRYRELLHDLGNDADRARAEVTAYLLKYPRVKWKDRPPAPVKGFKTLPKIPGVYPPNQPGANNELAEDVLQEAGRSHGAQN